MKRRFLLNILPQFGMCAVLNVSLVSVASAAGTAKPTPEPSHVVRRGDTIGGIARRYGVSIEALRAANGLARGEGIQAGQTLTLPAPETAGDREASTKGAPGPRA